MLKRTLVFESACHLGIQHGQLVYHPKENDKEDVIIPTEDIGVVLLDHPAITLSARALACLNQNGAAVIFCDESHHPCAMLQPLEGNTTHAETLRVQLAVSQPKAKQLWQQIVRAKILNQAALLSALGSPAARALKTHAQAVKSGDPDNREAVAARAYWPILFDQKEFVRDRDGKPPNNLLNYGYAILRAASARALVSSGLYCALGLHHRNRYNAFALADDFMEPYRPFVDSLVVALKEQYPDCLLNKETKRALLGLLATDTFLADMRRPLMNALSLSSASLVRCMAGQDKNLLYPVMP